MTETLTPTIEFTDPRPIEHFDPPGLGITPAEQLDRIRVQAPEFKAWLKATGMPLPSSALAPGANERSVPACGPRSD
jgi:hypothetical protein